MVAAPMPVEAPMPRARRAGDSGPGAGAEAVDAGSGIWLMPPFSSRGAPMPFTFVPQPAGRRSSLLSSRNPPDGGPAEAAGAGPAPAQRTGASSPVRLLKTWMVDE